MNGERVGSGRLTLISNGVGRIGADFVIDLDKTLCEDTDDFSSRQGVLQPVSEEDGEREGFAEFVRTWRWTGSLSKGILSHSDTPLRLEK